LDYIIADARVLPFGDRDFYSEKIVHLPHCYQANDSKRAIAARPPSRLEAGLPQDGLVFCCFNNNYKITRPVFDVWMRLLEAVGDSVLWLLRDNAGAQENLRRAAEERGIAASRLVFAERVKLDAHLARHSLADLFLDTLPYNAHTTASDALWAGIPVLTCQGKAFAGRVAASLLQAVGLPELVTHTLDEYESLARKLAADRNRLVAMREKLAQNRLICPLFDVGQFSRHIESAFSTMCSLRHRGENPRAFSVESTEN
jgi:predicted O-linked N-acetylglucosamine transferase (SPINDLY family)